MRMLKFEKQLFSSWIIVNFELLTIKYSYHLYFLPTELKSGNQDQN